SDQAHPFRVQAEAHATLCAIGARSSYSHQACAQFRFAVSLASRASNDADVSSIPPIIPYGGFFPLRLGDSVRLGCQGWSVSSCRDDHGNPPTNQVGRERWQSVHLIICPAVFDRRVRTLDVASLFEALANWAIALRESVRRSRVKDPDNWHRR